MKIRFRDGTTEEWAQVVARVRAERRLGKLFVDRESGVRCTLGVVEDWRAERGSEIPNIGPHGQIADKKLAWVLVDLTDAFEGSDEDRCRHMVGMMEWLGKLGQRAEVAENE